MGLEVALVAPDIHLGVGSKKSAVEFALRQLVVVPFAPLVDSVRAASMQRACRRAGETVRNLGDCQIAAVALRLDVEVMHCDRDFEVLARCVGLRTVAL